MAEEQEVIEEVDTEAEEQEEQEAVLPTVEELATEFGWKPRDQWKGDATKWRDPVAFIKEKQDHSANLRREVRDLRDKTDRILRTSAQATERLLAEQEAQINARWEQAVEDGDKQAAAKAQRDLAQLERQRDAESPESDFAKDNPWYGKDDEATAYAVGISQRLAAQGKSVSEQLKAASEGVRKRFPELFEEEEAKPRRQAPVLHAPSSRTAGAQKREKTAADLPRDVRQAGEEFVRMAQNKGRKYTIDDYARTYFAETGQVA